MLWQRRQWVGCAVLTAGAWAFDGGWGCVWGGEVTVRAGDTLWKIARMKGVEVEALRRANGLGSDVLRVGQKLVVPGAGSAGGNPSVVADGRPGSYTVAPGDTLLKISARLDVKLEALRAANGIEGHRIRVGQVLKVPGGSGAAAVKKQEEKKTLFVARVRRRVDVANLQEKKWKHVILHHSGTPMGSGKIFDYYHRNVRHMENGLAYHFVIGNGSDSGDGEIEVAERWARQIKGGHVKSEEYNENSIGICLVGNFERMRPTKKQIAAAVELVDHLKNGLLDGKPELLMHREMQQTLCPGRNFPAAGMHKLFG